MATASTPTPLMVGPIEIELPRPWPKGMTFALNSLPRRIWLVGPNGTGKSRFLRGLRDNPALASLKPRLVSTDRLSVARQDESTLRMWGDRISSGIQKSHMPDWIQRSQRDGAIVGTISLLYRRPELRLRVEATISQLLDRHIRLTMIDGNLSPTVRCGSSQEYTLFGDECHGVLELVSLLTGIYDDESQLLLIDEPEQHLHPQYQAFVLDELNRVGKRAVLATHSPSFLLLRTLDDLRGVICFHPDFSKPSMYAGDERTDRELQELLPRMTEQHRAFFFARSPVFVEGYFDATMVVGIQRALGLSAEAAGSCIIPSMGKDDAGRFLLLCDALGKKAVFLLDLDALFDRRLRREASRKADLTTRIAKSGHGDFDELVGRLQQALTAAVATVAGVDAASLQPPLVHLRDFLGSHAHADQLEARRIALLVALRDSPVEMRGILSGASDEIAGYLQAVLEHLASVQIHVLPGGALENYLPSYKGDRFTIPDESKRAAVMAEQTWLATNRARSEVSERYRDLGRIVEKLPAMVQVDLAPLLRIELCHLLHQLAIGIRAGHISQQDQVPIVLDDQWKRLEGFVSIALDVRSRTEFSGKISIQDRFGMGPLECLFDQQTQTSNPECLDLRTPLEGTRPQPSSSSTP